MSKTMRQRRATAVEATRRWRQRQAKGLRLITLELCQTTLDRLVANGLIPAKAVDDPARLGASLAMLLEQEIFSAGSVMAHERLETQAAPGSHGGDALTGKAGAMAALSTEATGSAHLQQQGRDPHGRWLAGTSGNPRGRTPGTRNHASWLADLLRGLE